jgi:hypothetical protein
VHQQNAGGALALGFLNLVGPASVIGQDGTSKDGGIPQAGIVHQCHYDLVLDIRALVIVPLVFRRDDPVAYEDQVASQVDQRIIAH